MNYLALFIFISSVFAFADSRDNQTNVSAPPAAASNATHDLSSLQDPNMSEIDDGNGKVGEVIFDVTIPPPEGEKVVTDRPGLQPGAVMNNSVSFPDTNREGFNPFKIEPHDRQRGIKTALVVINVFSFLAPALITTSLNGDFGNSLLFLLQGIQVGMQPSFDDAQHIYIKSFGALQTHAAIFMNEQASASLVGALQTLSQNINDQSMAYLNQLRIGKNTNDSIRAMANGSVPVPWVLAQQVDSMMRPIDSILSAPNNWFVRAEDYAAANETDAFALTGKGHTCLHTRVGSASVGNGAELVADTRCNLNDMQDKLWAIGSGSRLILRTDYGDKCVAYRNEKGDDIAMPLAIYDVSSPQCRLSSRPITLKESAAGEDGKTAWSLYDGDQELCLSDAPRTRKNKVFNGVVNPGFHRSFLFFKRSNKCKSPLRFTHLIPVLINNQSTGGKTGTSVTPSLTFDQLGIQLYYFPHFAGFHLAALKELYLHGSVKKFAKSQYYIKIEEYKNWVRRVMPVFKEYATFARINATLQMNWANDFAAGLDKANLEYTPVTVLFE